MPEKPRMLMFCFSFVKAVQFSKHNVSVVLVIEGFSCTALFVCVIMLFMNKYVYWVLLCH